MKGVDLGRVGGQVFHAGERLPGSALRDVTTASRTRYKHGGQPLVDRKCASVPEAAIRRAESAYREGNSSYVVVLETTRQLLESHLRQEQLKAELRRAWADLERSVGRRLEGPSPEASSPTGKRGASPFHPSAKCCHGPMAAIVCEACAKCCEACATECEKHSSDEVCKACAKSCRDCAKSCHATMKH